MGGVVDRPVLVSCADGGRLRVVRRGGGSEKQIPGEWHREKQGQRQRQRQKRIQGSFASLEDDEILGGLGGGFG